LLSAVQTVLGIPGAFYNLCFSSSTMLTLAVEPMRDTPSSIMRKAVSKVRMPPAALIFTSSPTHFFISATSSKVAPPVPKPVDVFMKSGRTSRAMEHSARFSSSVR
jgi:hypothetical protein